MSVEMEVINMKHRGIRFAILCLLSLLLMLAPMTRAEWSVEGGIFGVFDDGGSLITLACKFDDEHLITCNRDALQKLPQAVTDVQICNLATGQRYTGQLAQSDEPMVLISCDESLPGESMKIPPVLTDAGVYQGYGYAKAEKGIEVVSVDVRRPEGSELMGVYGGGELLPGSPICQEQNGEFITLGFAADGQSYVDVFAFYLSIEDGDEGAASNGVRYEKWLVYLLVGGAFLALVIVSNGKRGKRKTEEKQPASPEANVTEAVIEERKVTVSDDSRGRGCVVLEGINGALKGASFPITSRVVLGRDPSRCVIIFPRDEKGISAVHCAVEPVSDDAVLVTDLGSTYGTQAGSKQLSAGMSARVQAGEHIALGGSRNEFRVRVR